MLISGVLPTNYAFGDQLRQLKSDSLTLSEQTFNLAVDFSTMQTRAYDCYNQCHDAWSHAFSASLDTPDSIHAADGVAIGTILNGVVPAHDGLDAANTATQAGISVSTAELLRISSQVNSLIPIAPSATVAVALQEAAAHLEAAQKHEISANPGPLLAETRPLLLSALEESGGIAGDAPGVDVSSAGKAVMADVQRAQYNYASFGKFAYEGGFAQLDVSHECKSTAGSLDQALEQLPSPI